VAWGPLVGCESAGEIEILALLHLTGSMVDLTGPSGEDFEESRIRGS
jgi:hypothetical protein